MQRRCAIIGSRAWPDLWFVESFVSTLEPGTVVVSGGAKGVDSAAVAAAKDLGLETEVHEPVWYRNGALDRGAGFRRNRIIVQRSTEVVAFIYNKSKGSENTVQQAKALGKKVRVFRMEENEDQMKARALATEADAEQGKDSHAK